VTGTSTVWPYALDVESVRLLLLYAAVTDDVPPGSDEIESEAVPPLTGVEPSGVPPL